MIPINNISTILKTIILGSLVGSSLSFSWESLPDNFDVTKQDTLYNLVNNTNYNWEKPPFDQILVFGDSSCDTGEYFKSTIGKATPDKSAYWNGRFSDGPMWVEYMEAMNHIPVTSFCHAGSVVDHNHFTIVPGAPDFAGEITNFKKQGTKLGKRPLVISGYVASDLVNVLLPVERVGDSLRKNLLDLIDNHGIKDFLLMGSVFEFHYSRHYDDELERVKKIIEKIRPGTNILFQKMLNLQMYSIRIAPPNVQQNNWVTPPCHDPILRKTCNDPKNHFLVDTFHVTTTPQYNIAGYISRAISGYWAIE